MRFIISSFIAVLLLGIAVTPASAQTTGLTEAQIESVISLVASFNVGSTTVKNVEAALRGQATSRKSTDNVGTSTVKLDARLKIGSGGEEVRLLQKMLASDPALYPEGLITGFYGGLTETAVKRFQAKLKLEQVGVVGPQTLAMINEILAAAGVTGELPSDFLGSRVKIEVEIKNGKQEIQIEVKCDSSGTGNICNDDDEEDEDEDKNKLEIEVEIEDGKARVDVEQNGSESRFVLNITDRAVIIKELSQRLGLSEAEVKSVIEFESDEEDKDDDDEDKGKEDKEDEDDKDKDED